MVPFHEQTRKEALHEPPRFGLRRQSAAATALCRGCAVPSESKRGRASLAPAVQKAVTPLFYLTGSWSHFMSKRERRLSMNLRVLDCAGRAQRRRRFAEAAPYRVSQSGVALRLPPQSKKRRWQTSFHAVSLSGRPGSSRSVFKRNCPQAASISCPF